MPHVRSLWITAIAVAVATSGAAQEEASPRRQLEGMERALAEAVGKVSRPAAVAVLGVADSCRGYRLQGVGAWFVVSPRSLPERVVSRSRPDPDLVKADQALSVAISGLEQGVGDAPSEQDKETLRGGVQQLKERRRDLRARARGTSVREQELNAWAARAQATHAAAEEARLEAERALRLLESMLGRPVEANVLSAQRVPPSDDAGAQMPPWRLWIHTEPPEDPRSPDVLLHDVREAVTQALEEHGATLSLQPEEMIAVAVDFFRPSSLDAAAGPTRTLVVRVPKRVLELRRAGGLSAEEARRQFQIAEY
jgi:hypothetical protein